jgi:hypothetical protein
LEVIVAGITAGSATQAQQIYAFDLKPGYVGAAYSFSFQSIISGAQGNITWATDTSRITPDPNKNIAVPRRILLGNNDGIFAGTPDTSSDKPYISMWLEPTTAAPD